MTAESINEIAGYIALAAAIPAHLNVIVYGLGSPWYRSWLGRVLFAKWLSVALVFDVVLTRRWLGEYPGYEWVAVVVYSFIFIAFSATTVELVLERRSGSTTTPLPIRKVIRMSHASITKDTVPEIWFKAKRVIRTVIQTVVSAVATIAAAVLVIQAIAPDILAELALILPEGWIVWLAGAVAVAGTIAGALARIMAHPVVNAWLTRLGAGSVPRSAIEEGVIPPPSTATPPALQ